jgi:hypothetical protein
MDNERHRTWNRLKEKAAKELGVTITYLPIEVERRIQIQSTLGEDFDPEKIERVLAIFNQFDIERLTFFQKQPTEFEFSDLSPESKDVFKNIFSKCWTSIGEILGEDDFKKIYGESPADAAKMVDMLVTAPSPKC